MKRILFIVFITVAIPRLSFGQDYFEDIKGNGVPVLLKTNENKWLFVSRINIGDNSVKVNLFKHWQIEENGFSPKLLCNRNKLFLGGGIFGKAKTENGIGSIFGSGHIAPGFSTGGYVALTNRIWRKKNAETRYSSWILILSGTITGSEFQLYDTTKTNFSDQLVDSTFSGSSFGLSFTRQIHPGKSDLYFGISVTTSRVNNYKKMDKVDIKNDSLYSNGGIIRTVTSVNENGNTYGIGPYKEVNNLNIRGNIAYVPGFLDNQIAFVLYPSIDITKAYDPQFNIGFSVNFLKDGSPSVTKAALLFEFNDINNVKESTKPFLKRAFSIGITTSFNVITGKKE